MKFSRVESIGDKLGDGVNSSIYVMRGTDVLKGGGSFMDLVSKEVPVNIRGRRNGGEWEINFNA